MNFFLRSALDWKKTSKESPVFPHLKSNRMIYDIGMPSIGSYIDAELGAPRYLSNLDICQTQVSLFV